MADQDYYKILNVARNSSAEEIKKVHTHTHTHTHAHSLSLSLSLSLSQAYRKEAMK